MIKMGAPPTSVLLENANTSLLVMTRMHAPLIPVLLDNASTPQRAVTTAIHAPPILATKLLDARTLQSPVTTTTHAPKIPAILTPDVLTPQLTAVTETYALLILVSMETAFTPKKLATTKTLAPLKLAMQPPETASTLLLQSQLQMLALSEPAMQLKESLILQSTVKMETNALSTIAIPPKDANTLLNSSLLIAQVNPQDALVMLSA